MSTVGIDITETSSIVVQVYRCPDDPAAALRAALRDIRHLQDNQFPDIINQLDDPQDPRVLMHFFKKEI